MTLTDALSRPINTLATCQLWPAVVVLGGEKFAHRNSRPFAEALPLLRVYNRRIDELLNEEGRREREASAGRKVGRAS